ncbi:ribonuclease Y [Candidatus Peregrinibacteria bacterium]|nr:MAG: ribonuclease Y [Candidatus Peregrinibacteria bacterium]
MTLILLLLGLAVGGGAGFFFRNQQIKGEDLKKRQQQEKALNEAHTKANDMIMKAKNEAMREREEAQKEERMKRKKLEESEQRLVKKEEQMDARVEDLDKMKAKLEEQAEHLKKDREKALGLVSEQEKKLQDVAGLSHEEAKQLLLDQIEKEFKDELVHYAKKLERDMKEEVDQKARQILADAIQRYASETTVESTTTAVPLPQEDMKGRIIGREGRNINAFESVTGVDVIVDDTPGNIIISGFDPIRRYMAKITLERLVEDGRIHPARIEEMYAKVKEEVNLLIKDLGEKAAFEVGVAGLPPNLLKILGRLKFRIAYGQNVLKHSLEVAFLAAELAGLMGANVDLCKKAGLLHDIGKAVDHEVQGKHAMIGRDILKKFGLSDELLHCVEANEGDVDAETVEAKIVQVANLISVARPGANKDNMENYVKRLAEIEKLATDHEGIEKAFAVQAGRELRVFVNPENVDDLQSIKLSHELARQIEKELQYPGKIKVEVIREKRVEAFAG